MAEQEDYEIAYETMPMLPPADPVAARTLAFLELMERVDVARDRQVRKEGLEMLKRVRLSIRALSDAPLATVK